MNYKKVDLYLIFLLSLIAIYSLFKIISVDYSLSLSKEDILVAKISNNHNIVKKKRYLGLAWTDAFVDDALTYNDQIFTYKESQTTLNFVDKSILRLGENTLFKIGKKGTENEYFLEKGVIHAKLSPKHKKFKLNISGKTIEILSQKGTNIQFIKSKTKSKISILSGDVEIQSGSKKFKLIKNQVFKYDLNSKVETVEKVSLIYHSPLMNQQLYFKDVSRVVFAWSNSTKAKLLYTLEISKTHSFATILNSYHTRNNTLSIDSLVEGVYYFRVKAPNLKNIPTGSFRLTNLSPPVILSPNIEERYYLKDKLGLKDFVTQLLWTKGIKSSFEVNVTSPDESTVSKIVDKNYYNFKPQAFGNYRYKVRELVLGIKSSWSKERTFEVKKLIPIPIPKITLPKENQVTTFYDPDDMQIKVTLELDSSRYNSFEITILKIKNEDPVFKNITTNKNIIFKTQDPGKYILKARTFDEYNRFSKYSKSVKTELILGSMDAHLPVHEAKIVLKRPDQLVAFSWKKLDLKKDETYLLEVSNEKNFKNLTHSLRTKNISMQVGFNKLGVYYWRTKVKNQKTNNSRFTKPLKITVEPIPPPEKPLIRELELKIKKRFEEKKSVWQNIITFLTPYAVAAEEYFFTKISWEKKENIKNYAIEVFKDEKLSQKLLSIKTDKNFYEWKNPPTGKFYWRMGHIDFFHRQSSWSNISVINVEFEERFLAIKTPELVFPNHKTYFKFSNKRIRFSWKKQSNVNKYQLLFSKNLKFDKKDIFLKLETKNNYLKLKANILPVGKFYWRIVATNNYKRRSVSKRRLIKVFKQKKTKPLVTKKRSKRKQFRRMTRLRNLKKSQLFIAWAPSKDSYESSGPTYDANLDGTTLSSIIIEGKKHLKNNYYLKGNLSLKTGTIFSNQAYRSIELSPFIGIDLNNRFKVPFKLWFGGLLNSITELSYTQANTVPIAKNSTHFSPILSLEYEKKLFQNLTLNLEIGKGFLGVNPFLLKSRISYGKDFFYTSGINILSKSFETDNFDEISLTEIKFFIGVGSNF